MRRLVQRAFVLAGRDRDLRQHIREAHLSTLWIIEDRGLEWTVVVDRGKLTFERRPAKRPDVTINWRSAKELFDEASRGDQAFQSSARQEHKRISEALLRAFRASLCEVLRNPVDEDGNSLL